MFDNIASNKYLIIVLIIIIIILLFLYSRKRSCRVEGMKNVDLTIHDDITEHPWADDYDDSEFKSINNKTDKFYQNKNRNGPHLRSRDQIYKEYDGHNKSSHITNHTSNKTRQVKKPSKIKSNKINSNWNQWPKPLDDRPDLSQCQPCICPGDLDSDNDDSDSESNSDEYTVYQYDKNKKSYKTNKKSNLKRR